MDTSEPSYIQYGANDLGAYLSEISGGSFTVVTTEPGIPKSKLIIVIGQKMSKRLGIDLTHEPELGDEGAVIRAVRRDGSYVVFVAGSGARGTNFGIATLLRLVHVDGRVPYLEAPLNLRSKPKTSVRGYNFSNGAGNLKYPYGFRNWGEQDWKRVIDIAWAERANLILMWPFMEIIPVPLSAEDKAYLQEVRRIVDYAQTKRGIRVWIMQAANRVGISDCHSRDPLKRGYWVKGCQQDMNPADPEQFERIQKSFEALYQNVDNADGFCMIDSDPGGWPQSPISEQTKIFRAARQILDRYNVHGREAVLVDWMWVGWGRHFLGPTEEFPAGYQWTTKDPTEQDVAFMVETIRKFKQDVPEPWELVDGMSPYLKAVEAESVQAKTTYHPFGVLGNDVFPATNLEFASIRGVLKQAFNVKGLKGLMGYNPIALLEFPSTNYFFANLWDPEYGNRTQEQLLADISELLYPERKEIIANSFLALLETEPGKIKDALLRLETLIKSGDLGRPGGLGRFLFPNRAVVARDLAAQVRIRYARQNFIQAMQDGKVDANESSQLVHQFFNELLSWAKETGWTSGGQPFYDAALLRECGCQNPELMKAMSRLKHIVLEKNIGRTEESSYAQISAFFDPIVKDLLKKYDEDSVMMGCVEPFKLALIQIP
ncbi:MAG TPA: hypothetical protein VN577_18495 [Terriglobales bacterium]|nr:hypothetical protein [Terriglobales bacterium]